MTIYFDAKGKHIAPFKISAPREFTTIGGDFNRNKVDVVGRPDIFTDGNILFLDREMEEITGWKNKSPAKTIKRVGYEGIKGRRK